MIESDLDSLAKSFFTDPCDIAKMNALLDKLQDEGKLTDGANQLIYLQCAAARTAKEMSSQPCP